MSMVNVERTAQGNQIRPHSKSVTSSTKCDSGKLFTSEEIHVWAVVNW